MAISPALDIARRALLASETALGVVGNNIANVNTPGYTRQVADLEADAGGLTAAGVALGGGVEVRAIRQVVDPLLDRRQLGATTARGEEAARRDHLELLAGIVNDLGEPSLGGLLGGFFDAADALARNPEGIAERQGLLGGAAAVARELGRRSAALASLQRDVADRLVAVAAEADALLEEVAALNRAIATTEVTGQRANALRDERQVALDQLAAKLGVHVLEDERGAVRVSLRGGPVLVDGGSVVHGIATADGATGLDGTVLHEIRLTGPGGGLLALAGVFGRGELAGLQAVRDGALAQASANLDTFAGALRDAVNAIQTDPAARDLAGNPTTGTPLFTGTGAGDLVVAITDPAAIGAALSTEPGDNRNALRLADLRTRPPADVAPASAAATALGDVPLSGWLSAELTRVGREAAEAGDAATAAELFATELANQRAALSGVNLNEELTNLIKFERAFQAAAQVLNVTNAMLDELMGAV
jgi:flagellar hook-associated protein 1 FlgK